ncbi:pentatricopeptide repeat-containing protein At3g07290, mitochondrial [Cornus florida]|uniref:pentatricopeptide repeat-containing protein At3g07290, mitochondrial n=1 Tax=Cornus florida TaxID=4283 RepID=UPI00289A8004|nr:pentatricopeptide repeat-containing protein At3g07290, mitochondrial [Cornus florida]
MLSHTSKRLNFCFRSYYLKQSLSMLSSVSFRSPDASDDAVHRVSTLINQPNWEQDHHLKSLVSHMTPHVASNVMALNSTNIKLGVQFFKWVCKQSTYCYDLDSRIHLLNLLISNNLFVIAHKAIIVLIKECTDSENEILKLMGALDDMRVIGFRLNYPCYSTLLICLAKLSMGLPAFLVSRRMVGDGFVLDIIDYKNIINALCKDAFVQAAEMFLSRVLRLGFGLDAHIYTSLVLGSSRAGDLPEAFRVFDIMCKRDVCSPNSVTYSILIHCLCEAGKLEEAFRLMEEMKEKGCQPSTRTYTVLIKAVCDAGLMDKAIGLFDEMAMKGCKPNVHTYTVLIDRLCGEGKIEEANGMFRKMLKDGLFAGTVTYNALINGYCKQGRVISAFELLSVMERRNSKPNIRTYNELMEGLCSLNRTCKAILLLRKVVNNGIWPNRVSYNILIDGFCKEGQLNMAFNILNSMYSVGLQPDHFTYTTLIDGLCKQGSLEQANGLLGLMVKKGIPADEVTFTALINGYCKIGKTADAFRLFDRMIEDRCLTTPHAFNLLLDVFSKEIKVNEEHAILGKMVKYGLVPSVVTYTILIDGSFRVGDTSHSLNMLDLMKQAGCIPNVYTYNVVINGLCQIGRVEEAEALLFKMPLLGVSPNHITYTILVKAHVKAGRLDRAFEIVSVMVKNGRRPNTRIYSALLAGFVMSNKATGKESVNPMDDLGGRSLLTGEIDDNCISDHVFGEVNIGLALKFRDKIEECGCPIVDLYNLLVMGLCKVGRILEANDLIQDMVRQGLFPDKAVCSFIIEHYYRERKYDYCLELMKLSLSKGFVPSFASYHSLIVGLRNEGKFPEAQSLVSDLLSYAGIEDKVAFTPYIEFLTKEDEPHKCLEVLKLVEQTHHNERPIV